MNLKRILVAVNLLNARDAAFDRALALAQSFGAELYLLHAVPVDQSFSSNGAGRLDRMRQLRDRAETAGVRVQTVEQHGDAAEIIELHASTRAVDLIVLGAEPRGRWARHRSVVAERVIRGTDIPALVVAGDDSDAAASFHNILVAVDLSLASEAVLAAATLLTSEERARLTVLHAVKGVEAADAVRSPGRWKVPEYRTHVLEDARRRLDDMLSAVPADVNTRVHVAPGSISPADTILNHAEEMDADLIVLGRSRGFTLLGSTAQRVLRKNNRALLVVPDASGRAGRADRPLAA